jgi:hypothetical protein
VVNDRPFVALWRKPGHRECVIRGGYDDIGHIIGRVEYVLRDDEDISTLSSERVGGTL